MASDVSAFRPNLRWAPIVLGLVAAGVMFVRGCQDGPFGRHQVVALTAPQETQLGAQSYREVLSKATVVEGGPLVAKVTQIGERLAKASNDPELLKALKMKPQQFEWQFRVVKSPQVNAFCLPGGKVVVYTGIVPVAATEAGLATVMGHEIGHALAHHGAERMAQEQLVGIGQAAVAESIGDLDPQRRDVLLAVLGAGSQFGVLLPFSRKHESEADHIGLLLMAAAGYDPRASIAFWQRMDQQGGGGKRGEFTSTHPSHEHRARDLQSWLPEAMALYNRATPQDGNRPLPRQ